MITKRLQNVNNLVTIIEEKTTFWYNLLIEKRKVRIKAEDEECIVRNAKKN